MLLLNIDFVASGNAPEDYYDYACRKTTELEEHDPPILYDLWLDPGEADPLDSDKYCLKKHACHSIVSIVLYACHMQHALKTFKIPA